MSFPDTELSMRSSFVFAALVLVASLACDHASAQRSRAARVFAEAERLASTGSHADAAAKYEEAYQLVPANLALVLAASEWIEARSWDAAIVDLTRLDAERGDPDVDAFLPGAYETVLRARVRLLVRCATPCRIGLDRSAPEATALEERTIWTTPDVEHSIGVTFEDGVLVESTFRFEAGERMLGFAPPVAPDPAAVARQAQDDPLADDAPSTPRTRARSSRAGRAVALGALALAIALDGIAIASAVDAAHSREAYAADATRERWLDAVEAQRRTNILAGIAVSASAASSAGLVRIVRGRSRVDAGIALSRGAIAASARADF